MKATETDRKLADLAAALRALLDAHEYLTEEQQAEFDDYVGAAKKILDLLARNDMPEASAE